MEHRFISINSKESEYHFNVHQDLSCDDWINEFGLVLKAAINLTQNHLPNNIADHLDSIGEPTAVHEKVAASMCQESSLVILGLNAYSVKLSAHKIIYSYTIICMPDKPL